jgi:hypothetical protein
MAGQSTPVGEGNASGLSKGPGIKDMQKLARCIEDCVAHAQGMETVFRHVLAEDQLI